MTERIYPAALQLVGAEQLTSLAASAGFAAIPPNASWATIKPRSNAGVYLSLSGAAASTSMAISADVPVDIVTPLSAVRILQAAAGAIVDVWYWG